MIHALSNLLGFDEVLREVNGLQGGTRDEVGAVDHALHDLAVVDARARQSQCRQRLDKEKNANQYDVDAIDSIRSRESKR